MTSLSKYKKLDLNLSFNFPKKFKGLKFYCISSFHMIHTIWHLENYRVPPWKCVTIIDHIYIEHLIIVLNTSSYSELNKTTKLVTVTYSYKYLIFLERKCSKNDNLKVFIPAWPLELPAKLFMIHRPFPTYSMLPGSPLCLSQLYIVSILSSLCPHPT